MAPRAFTELERGKFLAALASGMTPKQAAEECGCSLQSVVGLRRRDEGFAESWMEAWDEGADILEAEAQRRAIDGVVEPVVSAGVHVTDVRKFSDTLLIFLLKSRRPDRFARFEVPGQHAKPVVVEVKQSPEQLLAVAAVLQRAGALPTELTVIEGGKS